MPDVDFSNLSPDQKISLLLQEREERKKEIQALKHANRTITLGNQPSPYRGVNESELGVLRDAKAELESALEKEKAQYAKTRDGHSFAKQNEIRLQINDIAQKIDARTPKSEFVPEIRSRSPRDQQQIDALTQKLNEAKTRLACNRGSAHALVEFNSRNADLKTFVSGLEQRHAARQRQAETARQRSLANEQAAVAGE
jgi:hypothetical protein